MGVSPERTDLINEMTGPRQYLRNALFFVLSFWLLNQVAYLFEVAENVSVFYPPSGFAMLLIYLFGAKYLPVFFFAIIVGGLPQRDIFNYNLEMLIPDLRMFVIYGTAGLVLKKLNPEKNKLSASFYYTLILIIIVTALLSSAVFVMNANDIDSTISAQWREQVPLFFVGNLTGALTALPIFTFFLYIKSNGFNNIKLTFYRDVLKPEKLGAFFVIISLSFFVIFLGKYSENYSSYYYLILIPIIWTSVKWGLGIGLMYAFIGNLFTLSFYVLFGYSYYGMLEVQLIFAMSIISTVLIGLVHEQKDIFYEESIYDELTGLANMRLFSKLSASMIAHADRNNEELALLFVDIDGFKAINDTQGHKAGDQTLAKIGVLLKNCLRDSDFVARYGGDEFVIQLNGDISEEDASTVASNIIKQMTEPVHLSNGVATIGASIGIAIYPRDGADVDTLISKADKAMYAAKKSGKNCYRLYSQQPLQYARNQS
ncbi:diguanylate cyclase domain-containing protein [Marinobacter salexigens]|uniref:diguanylate cyclase domain-containing protein n=1 Tax=Marinobacter salexigens TaxID=1925763 RepID=UPI000C293E00|nr:diguanylate cyclase [Marinobacter salexigens]